jgi:tRNA(Arg) A34 adenosine deaminase TadA
MHSVVHAEVNALMFRNCLDLEGCALYTTYFPCLECAKTIIRSGIKTLYYLADPLDKTDKTGDYEWDDKTMDEAWKDLQKDKPTFLASRLLLKEHNYKSAAEAGRGPCCKRYRPSKVFKVELQRQD